ncbi:Lrp/AsnC family transcriptional regulator [Chloroflexota bacterium]
MIKEILKILENDARATTRQIATMTASSTSEVGKLIKQAEKEGTIIKYKTIINWGKMGRERVWALIEVKATPEKEVGFDAIARRIYHFPQARTVYLVSGTYDLLVVVAAKTENEVGEFISEHLSTIEGVQGTVTHFVLKRYKEDGEMLEGEEEVKRQAVVL